MHELSLTQGILEIALDYAARNHATKILEIHLQIGEISDLEEEWFQRYFDFVSKGTIAEGAKLHVFRVPARIQCHLCSFIFPLDKFTWNTQCPSCQSKETRIVSGREFRVEFLEVL